MDYVGEWHTHPEYSPTPSMIDMHGWQHICSTRKAPMLFVIAGIQDRIWIGLGTSTGLRLIPELT